MDVLCMNDEYFMNRALDMAREAYKMDEVPVGCIIVKDNNVIASAYNRKEIDNIATYHAEVVAINRACRMLKTWRLDGCTMYTTVEPCMMCTGAILQSRISRVVYGTSNESFGYLSKIDNYKLEIVSGILKDECSSLMSDFFKNKR